MSWSVTAEVLEAVERRKAALVNVAVAATWESKSSDGRPVHTDQRLVEDQSRARCSERHFTVGRGVVLEPTPYATTDYLTDASGTLTLLQYAGRPARAGRSPPQEPGAGPVDGHPYSHPLWFAERRFLFMLAAAAARGWGAGEQEDTETPDVWHLTLYDNPLLPERRSVATFDGTRGWACLATRSYSGERLLTTREASLFNEAVPGVWLPRAVALRIGSPDAGNVEKRGTVASLRVNDPDLDATAFSLPVPEGVDVVAWHNP